MYSVVADYLYAWMHGLQLILHTHRLGQPRLAMAVVSGMIFLLSEKHEKIRSELLPEKKLVTFWLNSCGEDGLFR
jgi:hypothetical protein